jgi:cellulose synthase/poly-beta-1,6-N-acetylglucosamine synthase-like glycosyltransferase
MNETGQRRPNEAPDFRSGFGEARYIPWFGPGPGYDGWRQPLLGELAVEAGLLGSEAMQNLLAVQRRCGTRLGEIMVAQGAARPREVARLIAAQQSLRYIDLERDPADPTLADATALDFYIAARCLPWRQIKRETVYVAADPDGARAAIEAHEGRPCAIFVAAASDIDRGLRERFHERLTERARLELATLHPESSAQRRVTSEQTRILAGLGVSALAAFVLAPRDATIALNILLGLSFLAVAGLRILSVFVGIFGAPTREEKAYEELGPIDDADLPVYSVLVPLFREASVIPILADALQKLDYPASKLDIKLIFEETDFETYETAKALKLPGNFEFIRVPPSFPLTKPKACNFALPFARGRFLVVYDAEDLPAPDQLRRAVAAFELGDAKLACVQAQLNYYNWFENWLTRQFAIEYASFFDLLLPTLARLRLPVPLGGTSTHFRTETLRKVGAWDPFNVTEDADLGMRLALLGYRTGIIRSTTEEEANCRLDNWLRQRSRWIKGWIQTYFVRMRHPVSLYRALGLRGFLGFQLVVGGFSLSNIIHPLFYLASIATLATSHSLADLTNDFPIALFNLAVLALGYGVTAVAGIVAVSTRGLKALVAEALMMPAYWILISIASYKAMIQFALKPFHWEKTIHGISRLTAFQLARVKTPGP